MTWANNCHLGCRLDGDRVTCDNFPLPRMQHDLRALSIELHTGRGFFVLRGLHPTDYSVEDGMIVFLGIQAYIASQRARQDVEGNMIGQKSYDDAMSFRS